MNVTRIIISLLILLSLFSSQAAEVVGSRKITAREFQKPWPFTVPQGTVSCDSRGAITFTAGGKTYGINGLAKGVGYLSPEPIWKQSPDYEKNVEEYSKILNISKEEVRATMGSPTRISIGPILNAGSALCR